MSWFSPHQRALDYLGVAHYCWAPPQVLRWKTSRWFSCTPNKFPGDADTPGLGAPLSVGGQRGQGPTLWDKSTPGFPEKATAAVFTPTLSTTETMIGRVRSRACSPEGPGPLLSWLFRIMTQRFPGNSCGIWSPCTLVIDRPTAKSWRRPVF